MALFIGLCMLVGAYLYGVKVGRDAGVKIGRAQADSEWAVQLEHGMI